MPDEIQPALTPEEWRAVADERAHPENYSGRPHQPLTGVTISYTDGSLPTGYSLANPFTPHQLIALLNDALPDDDVRKVTHEDVTWLRQIAESADVEPGGGHDAIAMRDLAAKLAALLPPE